MDVTTFAAFLRASRQLSDDNQAVMDWADDTDFRLSVSRRELQAAVALSRRAAAPMRESSSGLRHESD